MRPVTQADQESLHDLIRAIEIADEFPFVTTLGEVCEFFDDPDLNPAHDIRAVEIDGQLIAWGRVVHASSGQRLERVFLGGGVHPDHRNQGIGESLLRWQIERAAARVGDTSPALPAYALLHAYDWESSRIRLAERTGMATARWSDELQRPLTDLPSREASAGIAIRPWEAGDNEAVRVVYNAAFADHWGSTPRTPESWASELAAQGTRLDLSFVAVATDENRIVGYSLNEHYPDDEAVSGRLDGWIGSIGTLRSHRKRGIASALIVESLYAFAEAGFNSSMLGVDTENPSGAYAIYERLGYSPLQRSVICRRTLREGA